MRSCFVFMSAAFAAALVGRAKGPVAGSAWACGCVSWLSVEVPQFAKAGKVGPPHDDVVEDFDLEQLAGAD